MVATIVIEELAEFSHKAIDRVKLYRWALIPAKLVSATRRVQNVEQEEWRFGPLQSFARFGRCWRSRNCVIVSPQIEPSLKSGPSKVAPLHKPARYRLRLSLSVSNKWSLDA